VLALTLGLVLFAASSAAAQQPQTAPDAGGLLTNFYKNPRPERLVGFLESFAARSPGWDAYPPVVGFFGVIFRKHPEWIDKLTSGRLDGKTAESISAALRLAGQAGKAPGLQTRLAEAGSDAKLKAELAQLPSRLEDLRVATPTHIDILWGASFASGDGRYPRTIIEFFARTANRSELVALDVAKIALAMLGGSKEILTQMRGKYGDAPAREMVFAATALWALTTNAQRHAFVDKAVADYVQEQAGSHAAKALSALRPNTRRA
jgi:hypothetical protein